MPRWIKMLSRWARLHLQAERMRNHAQYLSPLIRLWARTRVAIRAFQSRIHRHAADRGNADSPARFEPLEPRVLLSASLLGNVYGDIDRDGVLGTGETGRQAVTVFLDANANGVLDTGETSTATDSSGDYAFADIADGTHQVVVEAPIDWSATVPNDLTQSVTVDGTDVTGINFGLVPDVTAGGSGSVDEGSTYTLNLSAPALAPTQWTIDWGDGSTTQTVTGSPNSVGHTYSDNGAYTVLATVTDATLGDIDAPSHLVSVSNVAPTVSISGDASADVNTLASFASSVSDPGTEDTASYLWAVTKDGQAYDLTGVTTDQSSFSFTPDSAGHYVVELTVTDSDNADSVATADLTVVNVVTWTNASGGDWGTASNWSTGVLPTLNDRVVIDLASPATITHSTGNTQIFSLISNADIQMTGGTLDVADTIQVSADFQLAGGTITNARILAGTSGEGLSVTGIAYLNQVILDADLTIPDGKTLYVASGLELNGTLSVGDGTSSSDRSLQFNGNQTLSGAGEVVMLEQGAWVRINGGTLTIDAGMTLRGRGTVRELGIGNLVNNGAIIADVSGTLIIRPDEFTNNGTIQAPTGTLRIYNDWSGTGSVQVSGGKLEVRGSYDTTGLNQISKTSGDVELYDTLNNTGQTFTLDASTGSWMLCDMMIQGGAIETLDGTQLLFSGNFVTLNGVTLNTDLTIPDDKIMYVANGLVLNGTLSVGDGTHSDPSTLRFNGDQTLSGTGEVVMVEQDARLWINESTLTIGAGVTLRGRGDVEDIGTGNLVNNGAIIADVSGTLTIRPDEFTNNATVQTPTGTLRIYNSWSGTGSVQVNGGKLEVRGSYDTTGLNQISKTSGDVELYDTLNNTGQTLTLDASTGSWMLYDMMIQGGAVEMLDGTQFLFSGNFVTFNGVTLNTDLTIPDDKTLYVTNGLVLNSTLFVGDGTHSDPPVLRFNGDQTLSGTGEVVMVEQDARLWLYEGTLTIDTGVTLRGRGLVKDIGTGYLVNNGAIIADVSGTLTINPDGFTNNGTVLVAGGTLVLDGVTLSASLTPVSGSTTTEEGTSYSISLSATDLGNTSWEVDWGDGSTDQGLSPASTIAHTYADQGAYALTATVTDPSLGDFGILEVEIDVQNVAPSVSISGPSTCDAYDHLTFEATAVDPAGVNDPLTYLWSVTKDGQAVDLTGMTVDELTFDFTPVTDGDYVIAFSASDDDGGVGVTTSNLTVQSYQWTPLSVIDPSGQAYATPQFNELTDVTSVFDLTYHSTSFNPETRELQVSVSLAKLGVQGLHDTILLSVSGIDNPQIVWANSDGELPLIPGVVDEHGLQYVDISWLLDAEESGLIEQDADTGEFLLKFYVPQGVSEQFDFDITLYGQLNHAPEFVTTPPDQVRAGNVYVYDAEAEDPDGDEVTYGLLADDGSVVTSMTLEGGELTIDPQTGVVTWNTDTGSTNVDPGVYNFTIVAQDHYQPPAPADPTGVIDVIRSAFGVPGSSTILPSNLLLKYFNRDMGTVYDFDNVGDTYTYGTGGADDIDNPGNLAGGSGSLTQTSGSEVSNATGSRIIDGHVEDMWGIGNVTTIDVGDNGVVDWVSGADTGSGAEYITIMFYGGYNTSTTLLAGEIQDTQTANVHMDIYVTTTNPAENGLAINGSSDRTGDSSYNGITDGTLILSLLSDSFNSLYQASSGTSGSSGYFSVTGGSMAEAFDTNTYDGSDFFVQFTTAPRTPSGANDWLLSSNDPARAYVVEPPESTIVFDDYIAPNLDSSIKFKTTGRAMETLYDFSNGSTYEDTGDPANINDINNPSNIAQQAPGAMDTGTDGLEDYWGIAKVVTFYMPGYSSSLTWHDGLGDRELTIFVYNAVDFYTTSGDFYTQTSSAGMIVDIYESDTLGDDRSDFSLGSSGRTGMSSYDTITDGELVLRLQSEAGHINTAPGGLETEFYTRYYPTSTGIAGAGHGYFSVIGGAWAEAFDTDTYAPLDSSYNTADTLFAFTTDSSTTEWTISTDDPIFGYVASPSEPASASLASYQLVQVEVVDDTENRPPQFTTVPITYAYAGVEYVYEARAEDPDHDLLSYYAVGDYEDPLGGGPIHLDGDPDYQDGDKFDSEQYTGRLTWTPDESLIGHTVTITFTVSDGHGGEDVQVYDVLVLADPANQPPVITSEPGTDHSTANEPGTATGDVSPSIVELVLAPGEDATEQVLFTAPSSTGVGATADIVLVVDESGSMSDSQDWLTDMVLDLEQQLEARGITGNRYALVGFGTTGDPYTPPHLVTEDQPYRVRLFGPSNELLASFEIDGPEDIENVLLPSSGQYTVVVDLIDADQGLDTDFEVSVEPETAVMVEGLGVTLSGQLDGTQTVQHQFSVPTGRRVYFDAQYGSSSSVQLTLTGPSGQDVHSWSGSSDYGPVALQEPGQYTLTLTGTGDYEIDLIDLESAAGQMDLDASASPVTGSISAGETRWYAFDGTVGQAVYWDVFDTHSTPSSVVAKLYEPNTKGENLIDTAIATWSYKNEGDPHVLEKSGRYYIQLTTTSTSSTTYKARLTDLSTGTLATPTDVFTDQLTTSLEDHIYRFDVAEGDRIGLSWSQSGPDSVIARLYNPAGEIVSGVSTLTASTDGAAVDASMSGRYTLVLRPNSNSPAYPIDYTLSVGTAPTNLASMSLGDTKLGTVGEVGERDIYTFTLTDDTRVLFDSFTDNPDIRWTLRNASGDLDDLDNLQFRSDDNNKVLELGAGDYELVVFGDGDSTGNYSFRLLDLSSASALTLGQDEDPTLSNEKVLYQFEGSAGDEVFFDSQPTGISGDWYLLNPYGDQVATRSLGSDSTSTITLQMGGTYTLLLAGDAGNAVQTPYTFALMPVVETTTSLSLGDTKSGAVGEVGERYIYTFTLTDDTRVLFDSFTDNPDIRWTLRNASGDLDDLDNQPFSSDDNEDVLELGAGDYELVVFGDGDSTGNYSFRLLDLSSASALTLGQAVALNEQTEYLLNKKILYQFEGSAGDEVFFDSQTTGISGDWYLLNPYGDQVATSTLTNDSTDTITLKVGGTYTLLLAGDADNADLDPYTFALMPVVETTISLVLGDTKSSAVGEVGERDIYTFTLTDDTRVLFDSFTNSLDMRWTLRNASGDLDNLDDLQFRSDDNNKVLEFGAGDYELVVFGDGDSTGNYSFRLLDLSSASALTLGLDEDLSMSNEKVLYQFEGAAGASMYFNSQSTGVNGDWYLLDPYGDQVAGGYLSSSATSTFTLDVGGTYTLILAGDVDDTQADTYTFQIGVSSTPTLTPLQGAQPLSIGATVDASISVSGEQDGYTFTLSGDTRVLFDSLTNDPYMRWTLRNASGDLTGLVNQRFSTDVNNNVMELGAGDYELVVFGYGTATGDYSFRLLDLSSASALTVGQPVTLNEQTEFLQNKKVLYQFEGSAGDELYFDSQTTNFGGYWYLLDPYGDQVTNATKYLSSDSPDIFTLDVGGTYTLILAGNPGNADLDPYTFALMPAVETTASLTLGDTKGGLIDDVAERHVYTFTLADDTRVLFDSFTYNSDIRWTLRSASGDLSGLVDQPFASDVNNKVLELGAGDYELVVFGDEDSTGNYSFRLLDLSSASALTLGQAETLNEQTEFLQNKKVLYQFEGSAGDELYFDSQTTSVDGNWYLLNPYGDQIAASDLGNNSSIALEQGGTYTLILAGDADNTTETPYTFTLVPVVETVAALALGDTVPLTTLNHTVERHVYTFTLTDDTRVLFDALTNHSSSLKWQLRNASGELSGEMSFSSDDAEDVLELGAGDYELVVFGIYETSSSYSFRLLDMSSTSALTLGQEVTLNEQTEYLQNKKVLYQFEGSAGDELYFDSRTTGVYGDWYLLDPYGDRVDGGSGSLTVDSTGTFTLDTDGTYTLLLAGDAGNTAQTLYTFVLMTVVETTASLTLGDIINGSLSSPAERDIYEFTGAAGQQLYFDGISRTEDSIEVSLLMPNGTAHDELDSIALDADTSGPLTLLYDGIYRLTISAYRDGVGDYTFRLSDVALSETVSTVDLTPVQLASQSHTAIFHIDATQGQSLKFGPDATELVWKTASETSSATGVLTQGGGFEDGYAGIFYALSNFEFRADASINYILVTDEDRDYQAETNLDRQDLVSAIDAQGAILTSIIKGSFSSDSGSTGLLGVDSDATVYIEDGAGGYFTSTGGVWTGQSEDLPATLPGHGSIYENTYHDYVIPAWNTGGAAWDINLLDDNDPDIISSFTHAFVDLFTDTVEEQFSVDVIASDPSVTIDNLTGLITGLGSGEQAAFDIKFHGQLMPQSFDLQFVRSDDHSIVLGTIPIRIDSGYLYDVDAVDPDGDVLTYSLVGDDHGATIDSTSGFLVWNPQSNGDYEFTVMVDDGHGGQDVQTWTVHVTDVNTGNSAPQLLSSPPTVAEVGKAYAYQIIAEDADNDTMWYQLVDNPPAGMSIDPFSGLLTWTPDAGQVGSVDVHVQVIDGRSGSADQTFSIDVSAQPRPNTTPFIYSAPATSTVAEQPYVYHIQAFDPDGDALTYDLVFGPDGMAVDATTGQLVWTPGSDQVGAHTVMVAVADSHGAKDVQVFELTAISLNRAPTIISTPDDANFTGNAWQYRVQATDVNGDTLTYRVVDDGGAGAAFSTTPGDENLLVIDSLVDGDYVIKIAVEDGRGGSDTQQFSVTFNNNKPPVFGNTPTTVYSLDDPAGEYTFMPNVTDPDNDTVTLSLDAASKARGMVLDSNDPNTTLRWTPSIAGDYAVRITAQDSAGNARTLSYTLRVVDPEAPNEPPVITSTATGPAVVDRTWSYLVTTDDPNGDSVNITLGAFTDAHGNDLSSQVTQDGSTPGRLLIQWTPVAGVDGPIHIEIQAADAESTVTQSFDLPVLDNAPPVVGNPRYAYAEVGSAYSHDFDISDPNSGDTLEYAIISGGQTGMDFAAGVFTWNNPVLPAEGNTYDIELRVTDSAGASVNITMALAVYDTSVNVLPTILSKDPNTDVAYARTRIAVGQVFQHQVAAEDANGDTITYDLVGAPAGMSIDSRGLITWMPTADDLDTLNNYADKTYNFTATVSDDGGTVIGDTATFSLTVTRESINNAPMITSTAGAAVMLGGTYYYQAQASDADGDPVAWALAGGPQGAQIDAETGLLVWKPTVDQLGSHALTIQVLDSYGAGQTQTFTVEVRATNLPPQLSFSAPTHAYAGQTDYTFDVSAIDPDGGAVSLVVSAVDSQDVTATWLDSVVDNADGTWTVSSSSVGAAETYTVTLTATDSAGRTDSQSFTLNVSSTSVNQPPQLVDIDRTPGPDPYDPDSGSIFVLPVAVGELYTYTIQMYDPNGDTLSFSLDTGTTLVEDTVNIANPTSGQVSLEANGNALAVRWRPSSAQAGHNYVIVVKAQDAEYSMSLPISAVVRANVAPTVEVLDDVDAVVGGQVRVQVEASDANGDSLTYALADGVDAVPAGMLIDSETGLISWSPAEADLDLGQPATYTVDVVVSDTYGASTTRSLTVNVAEDVTLPTVAVITNNSAPLVGETVTLTVTATDAAGVAARWITINDVQYTLNSNGQVQYTVADSAIVVQGFARDVNGNEGSSNVLTITPYTLSEAPTLSITGPTQDVAVKQYTEITGVIDDDFLNNETVYYRALLIRVSTGTTLLLGEGSTTLRVDGQIGIGVDPTLVDGGSYILRLQASNASDLDNPGQAPVRQLDTRIEIDADVPKIGNFALSFTDLSTSVSGIPIVITRSYDTADAQTHGDFGYGWTLDIATGSLEVSNLGYDASDTNWLYGSSAQPYQYGTRLEFTLPGGQTMGFTAVPNIYGNGGLADGILGAAGIYTVAFQPDADTLGTKLEFTDGSNLILEDSLADAFGLERGTFIDTVQVTDGGTALYTLEGRSFNPVDQGWDFRLTTRDGTEYIYDSGTGRLLKITDRQGNKLDFSNNASGEVITSRDNTGLVLGKIQIERDSRHRVVSITDLQDADNGSITYTYDTDGNLESVTDRSGRTTTYGYNLYQLDENDIHITNLPDHYLTQIHDANDVKTLQAVFYAEDEQDATLRGRLKGLEDASGNSADFSYTLDGETFDLPGGTTVEQVKDANDIPTEVVRDASGNVVRSIQQIDDPATTTGVEYLVSVFEYDSNNNQTVVWQPFTVAETASGGNLRFTAKPVDYSSGSTQTVYDSLGNPTRTTDALGNVTTFAYDKYGNPTVIVDPLGNVTRNAYDSSGRLTRTTDAEGNITAYVYDSNGNLQSITQYDDDDNEITPSDFAYANGRLIQTTDLNGVSRYFAYDAAGNQTHSWSVNDGKTLVSVTEYDEEGRVTVSSQFTLNSAYTGTTEDRDDLMAALATATPDWQTSTDYDLAGRVITTTDRFGSQTFTRYDSRSNVVETRTQTVESGNARFIVTRTAYDDNGRVIASSDPFLTDLAGNLITLTADLRLTQTVYDDLGRVTQTLRVQGAEITLAEDSTHTGAGLYTTSYTPVVASDPSVSTYSETFYDTSGRVDHTINYNLASDANDDVRTDYYYDAAGRQIAVLGAVVTVAGLGQIRTLSTTEYDAAGRQAISTTGIAVLDTIPSFAAHPELTNLQIATYLDTSVARSVAYVYDALGRVTQTTAQGNTPDDASDDLSTQTIYDALGRRVAEIDSLGRRTDYEYDAAGRLISVTLPAIDPDGSITGTIDDTRPVYQYAYDANGNQISITDPLSHVTDFAYDYLNRQQTRTLPIGVETTGDPDDFIESMHYDDTPIATVQAGSTPESSVAGGQLEYAVDFEGRVTAYRYDNTTTSGGRLVGKYYYGTESAYLADRDDNGVLGDADRTITYTYDAFGRQKTITDDEHGVTSYEYDAEGRLTQTDSPEGILNYEYDALGRLTRTFTSKTAAGADAVTDTRYSYDALGRLSSVEMVERNDAPVTGEITTYAYDASGAENYEHNTATGVTMNVSYDSQGRAIELNHFQDADADGTQDAGENTVAKFTYTYDAAGNRTSAVELFDVDADGAIDHQQKFNWTYDGLNRLRVETFDNGNDAVANAGDYVTRYTFDLASNRTWTQRDVGNYDDSNFVADQTVEYAYDANDRLLSETKIDGSDTVIQYTEYAYDGTTQTEKAVYTDASKTTLTSRTVNTYNEMGRLSKIELDNDGDGNFDSTIEYAYDADGLRISTTTDGVTTLHLFDKSNFTGHAQVIEEGVDDNADGRLQAGEIDKTFTLGSDVIAQMAANELLIFLYDIHGSTRAVLDSAGTIKNDTQGGNGVQAFTYDAYGNLLATGFGAATQASALTSLLYSGEFTNAVTGQQYLRARFYDPSTGRFNRLDPYAGNTSDPLSLHKYAYVHGNPIMGIDPSGRYNLVIQLGVSFIQGILRYGLDLSARVTPATYVALVQLNFIALRAYQIIPAVLNGLLIGSVVLDVGFTMIDKLTANRIPINEAAVGPLRPGEVTAVVRGRMVEEIAGANIRGSFRGIDDFRQGVATQIKSYFYDDRSRLLYEIEKDLKALSESTSTTLKGKTYDGQSLIISPSQIQARQLLVALPENTRMFRDSAFISGLRALSNQYRTAIRPTIVRFWTVRR
ncbi:LEPR-XLL domain-containing protein [Planctomycetales bacterium ZRK34]|nr:LEPR-XLL domain-containing protein [Planctomycetales bacterium ZRK34]